MMQGLEKKSRQEKGNARTISLVQLTILQVRRELLPDPQATLHACDQYVDLLPRAAIGWRIADEGRFFLK